MAPSSRASRALLFMQHCRQSWSAQPRYLTIIRHSSSTASPSPYNPSNFTNSSSTPKPSSTSNDTSHTIRLSSLPSTRPQYAHPRARSGQPPMEIVGQRFTFTNWLKTMLGFPPKISPYKPAPFRVQNNPYRARKKWPPDFRNLDAKQQFHFEKTYRRRAKLKWARPTWNKSIKILQHTLITATILYFVFILEPDHGQGTPFDGFRAWFFEKMGSSESIPEATREEAEKLSQAARQKFKAPGSTT